MIMYKCELRPRRHGSLQTLELLDFLVDTEALNVWIEHPLFSFFVQPCPLQHDLVLGDEAFEKH